MVDAECGSPAVAGAAAWTRFVGPALALLAVGLAALVHYGVGPALGGDAPAWTDPRGFLREPLRALGLTSPILAVPALMLPMIALAVAVFLTTRSALARTAAVVAALATGLFTFYGQRAVPVWEIFGWRWSATLTLLALVVGAALCAVPLARSWRALGWPARVAVYAPVFAFLLAYERNVTGTDPSLPFALSPWPLVQVVGLEGVATGVALLLMGVAGGLLAASALRGRVAGPALAALAAAVAVGLPALGLGAGAALARVPWQERPATLPLLAVATMVVLAAAALPLRGRPRRLAERGRRFATAALLLGAPLLVGQTLTRLDYRTTREERAGRIIRALDAYYERDATYPETLDALVAAGDLDHVPEPRIGFPGLPRPDFLYQSFGTSYMLEFAAPRWIQCAYNPPWEDELADGDGGGGEDVALADAWSCPSTPPEMW